MMSYLAAIVLFVGLEQPLSSLEALGNRKPSDDSVKPELSTVQEVGTDNHRRSEGHVIVNKNV